MEQLWERLEAYVRSYLPWWRYDREGREPEAALLTALGSLLEDTAARLQRLPEKHEIEFLRAFGEQTQSERACLAWAALSAPRGALIPAGTQFYLSGDGTRLWRTQEDVTASPCRLACQVFSGGESGRLLPAPPPERASPTRLFDFGASGAQRRQARFSHPDAFASRTGCAAALVFAGASEELTDFLARGPVLWSLGGGAEIPLEAPRPEGDALNFRLPPAPEAKYLLVRVPDGVVPPAGAVGAVYVETRREELDAESVVTEEGVQGKGTFLPFGEEPRPWQTCCIGCEDALSLRGAEAALSWTATLGSLERPLPGSEGERPLKPVMRRLPPEPPEVREVYADAVIWEYWDGGGWRPIPGAQRYARVFGALEESPAHMQARFSWPPDAARCELQGRKAYWLRWRVRSAQGWDALPRRNRFPEISGLKCSAVLRGAPVSVERCCGLEEDFSPVRAGQPLFPDLTGPGDAWWLGFDPPPEKGALDLWLILEGRTPGGRLSAWEAQSRGERRVSLTDGTGGLGHSGALRLRGILGQPCTRFGKKLWWLCLRREAGETSRSGAAPVLTALECGAVLLRAQGGGRCSPGEALRPLRGGTAGGKALTGSFGGSAGEGEDGRSLQRARNLRRHLGRGSSASDIDRLLRDEMPDVVRTRCVRTGDVMEVGILLRDAAWHSVAFEARRGEARRILEAESVLPALGVKIAVREPCFYAVHTSVWMTARKGADLSALRRRAAQALERFLDPVAGGPEGRGWPMGRLPRAQELEALLREELPEAELTGLLCAAAGPDAREVETDAVRDAFALPVSGAHAISVRKGGTV